MDRLQAMTAFLAVVDAGGFAAAARRLKVSAPVVTRAVAELEDRLGVRLLTRTTRTVRLTDTGAAYAGECRRILAEIAEAEEAASGARIEPRGLLAVTAPVLFGNLFVTPIVTEYLVRHPQANATTLYVDRLVNLVEEGIDVAVRIGELADSSLQAVRVGRVERVTCAAPSYLAGHGTPREPADLTRHRIVAASGVTPLAEWRYLVAGRLRGVKLAARLATSTNDSAITAALAGFGITRVLSYQVAAHLAGGQLVPLLARFEPPPLPIHVVHREGRHAARRVRAFVDLAVERLRAEASLR